EGHGRQPGRPLLQAAQVAAAVAARHEVQVQGPALTELADDVEHRLEAAPGDGAPGVDEAHGPAVDGGGGQVGPRGRVAHHLRTYAVALGVEVGDGGGDRRRRRAARQVGAAQVVHERGDEQPPGGDVAALLGGPLV